MYVCRVPGSAVASFRNKALMLKPAFALDSMNIMPSFVALSSPAIDTSDGEKYANLKKFMFRLKHTGIEKQQQHNCESPTTTKYHGWIGLIVVVVIVVVGFSIDSSGSSKSGCSSGSCSIGSSGSMSGGNSGGTMIPHNGCSSGIVKSTLLTNWFMDNINMRFERKTYDFSISNRINRC